MKRHWHLYRPGALCKLKWRVQKKRMTRAARVERHADVHYRGCVVCFGQPFGDRVT